MSPVMVMFREPVVRVLFVMAVSLLPRQAGKGREKVHEANQYLFVAHPSGAPQHSFDGGVDGFDNAKRTGWKQ
jgi:hypothetical protein